MKRAVTPSTLSLAILGLISHEPLSGYDLRKIFATTPMGHFSNSPGAIYPALSRLEEGGLIKGTIEKRETLRPRQTYRLTKDGWNALKDRLSKPVTEDDVIWRLDELVLRFALMGDVLGRENSALFLEELVSNIGAYLPTLRAHLKAQRKQLSVNGAYALEQGIAKYEATARWARRVIRDLRKNER